MLDARSTRSAPSGGLVEDPWSVPAARPSSVDAGAQLAIPSPGDMEEPEWHAVADAAVTAAAAAASRQARAGVSVVGAPARFTILEALL